MNRVDRNGKEWEIETIKDKTGTNVNIKITGVLLNLSNETFDMEALNKSIKEQLEFTYSFQINGFSLNLTADIRLVESINDIIITDHVFMVVDQSNFEKGVLAKSLGYGISIGTILAAQTISGENQRSVAHELGHSGGLHDVNLNKNDLKIYDPARNLMTQIIALPKNIDKNVAILLEREQINRLIYNYNNKSDDMSPYFHMKFRTGIILKALNNKKIK